MPLPLQITFRDMTPSTAVAAHVTRHGEKLQTFFPRLVRCHVVVEEPHRHHVHGKRFHVRIAMSVPGQELVVSRDPSMNRAAEDMYAAIDAAFGEAERLLESFGTRRHDLRIRRARARTPRDVFDVR